MVIAFEPQFNLGDIVCLKINPDRVMQVETYHIKLIDRGKVIYFQYGMYDDEGIAYSYSDADLQIVTKIECQ